jgi:hypothetical protein
MGSAVSRHAQHRIVQRNLKSGPRHDSPAPGTESVGAGAGTRKAAKHLSETTAVRHVAWTTARAGSNPQLTETEISVHRERSAECGIPRPCYGTLKVSRYSPRYNNTLLTPRFTLNVTFEDMSMAVSYSPVRFRANLLIEFEGTLCQKFPEKVRSRFGSAMDKGYSLVMFKTGTKKRIPIYIRGPRSIRSDAAFTGFLNTVADGSNVLLEWE